ncbi:hypothetical protein V6N13_123482 [Hibiscus sabdariffa]|uniref:Uncharacterized protein n=1 Tax=Hibiscus sabdariffa TaxID=183260 RepID=A0ABR2QTK8_9ROSI
MVQTRSQVRKRGQPLLPMHVSLSSDDSSSPNSSRHHHLSKHQAPAQPHPLGAAAAPQQRTQVQPQQHPSPQGPRPVLHYPSLTLHNRCIVVDIPAVLVLKNDPLHHPDLL